jgi:hypothetical protein
MMGYKFWEYEIPDLCMEGILRYTEKHMKAGDFLMAVFRNDFMEAVSRADDINAVNLKAYMGYLYNVAPGDCWGSPEKVKAWLENRPG